MWCEVWVSLTTKSKPPWISTPSNIYTIKLAKLLRTSTSVIGRYERDEMIPSIEVAQKIAN
ncbi:MAG: helix-turn-helix transcriptional regulator, partial [Bacteroidota bacterium]